MHVVEIRVGMMLSSKPNFQLELVSLARRQLHRAERRFESLHVSQSHLSSV
jgi:hypothetical protein